MDQDGRLALLVLYWGKCWDEKWGMMLENARIHNRHDVELSRLTEMLESVNDLIKVMKVR